MAEEQRKNSDKRGRRSGEPERVQHLDAPVNELKLKEQQLHEREQAIKDREQRLERMIFPFGKGVAMGLRFKRTCADDGNVDCFQNSF